MGGCGSSACPGSTNLQGNDGLLLDRLSGDANQLTTFAYPLEVKHDGLRISIVFQIRDVLMEFDADGISYANDLTEPCSPHASIVSQ